MGPAEVAAIDSLAAAHGELLLMTPGGSQPEAGGAGLGLLDLHSEAGHLACVAFLCKMEAAAEALRLEVAPRTYRADFSVNYRALFPDGARHYRVDVLEVSVDRHSAIWVNGDKFELSSEAIAHAEQLQHGLADLGAVLAHWRASASRALPQAQFLNAHGELQALAPLRPSRGEIVAALAAVDMAWAAFEQRYIANLIDIEDRARQLIVRAVEAEQRLGVLEAFQTHTSEIGNAKLREAQCSLIACISRLNSVANCRRKGRDDLDSGILESAVAALAGEAPPVGGAAAGAGAAAARVLAADVIGTYDAVREYLREVKSCLERVDPHLCNNAGLVARLVDWEESWEVGGRYIRDAPLLDALCELVAKMQTVRELAPALGAMLEGCDVELFFVLPRLMLLAFLQDPVGKQADLLRILLPHRFGGRPGPGSEAARSRMRPELRELAEHFRGATRLLEGARPRVQPAGQAAAGQFRAAPAAEASAWGALARGAVGVSGCKGATCTGYLEPALRGTAQNELNSFSRELEGWSLELQRHCPEDWNSFSAVLVQCLTGTSRRHKFLKFQV